MVDYVLHHRSGFSIAVCAPIIFAKSKIRLALLWKLCYISPVCEKFIKLTKGEGHGQE
jgi:hypothetical protein